MWDFSSACSFHSKCRKMHDSIWNCISWLYKIKKYTVEVKHLKLVEFKEKKVYSYKKYNINIPKVPSAGKVIWKGHELLMEQSLRGKGFQIIQSRTLSCQIKSLSGQWSAFTGRHSLLSLSQSLLKAGRGKKNGCKIRQYKISQASPQILMILTGGCWSKAWLSWGCRV